MDGGGRRGRSSSCGENHREQPPRRSHEQRTDDERRGHAAFTPGTVDLKLEVAIIPVADVDRSKRFYQRLGWRLDADFSFDNGFRVVQLTPPGSGGSIQFVPS